MSGHFCCDVWLGYDPPRSNPHYFVAAYRGVVVGIIFGIYDQNCVQATGLLQRNQGLVI